MANTRKVYAGAATVTTITAGVTSTATAITIDDPTGWPSGGEFTVAVDPETASEEKFLANGRTGNTITLATSADRGIDGTSAQAHNAGAKIYCTLTAGDLDEANNAVVNTVGRITAKGGLLVGTSNATLAQLAAGTNGQWPHVDTSTTTGLAYGGLPDGAITTAAKFAAGVVDAAALGTNAVTTVKINALAVTEPKIADDAVITRTIAADAVTGNELADDAVGNEHLEDDAVATANIQDAAVTAAKLIAAVPLGYIDSVRKTSMQTCGATTTSVTGMAVTWTAVANRRYRITASIRLAVGTVASNVLVSILGDGTTLCRTFDAVGITGPHTERTTGSIDWVPGAGSRTARVDVTFTANANNEAGGSSATDPAYVLVEDIGGT
jgi:hypothetical protein